MFPFPASHSEYAPSLTQGHANPYGISDVLKKQGFVNVGRDRDRVAFAVESIRRWWKEYGSKLSPQASGLLLTADGGGSNGARTRLFQGELQKLANELQLPITLCHYPPATSKWNVIEYQLFSFISIHWRAKPLTSLAVILELISQTTTQSGLTVTAMADTNPYPTGRKVSDEAFQKLNILRDSFHGDWNYTINPQKKPCRPCATGARKCWPSLTCLSTRLSNGFVEGKNNRMKALMRQGYGYRNRDHLRLRLLLEVA